MKFIKLNSNTTLGTCVYLSTENIDIEDRYEGGYLIYSGSGRQYSATEDWEIKQVEDLIGKEQLNASRTGSTTGDTG